MPIRIYELIGKKRNLPDDIEEKLGICVEALNAYRSNDFTTGMKKFELILKIDVGDDPSLAYVERCQRLLQEHILNDWDGAYTLTAKELITEGLAVVW